MILITGATGKVGKDLVAEFRRAKAPFRVLARDPRRANEVLGQVEAVAGDLSRPDSLARALDGVERAFLLPPTDPRQPEWERSFVSAAKAAGVKHVVKLSVAGVDAKSPLAIARWHAEGEEALRASGPDWTMLRPSFFHQNFLMMADQVREGTFYGAMGSAKVSMVDTRDIAAAAFAALTRPGHEGKAYTLATGAHSYGEAAETFTRVLGRKVVYAELPPAKLRDGLTAAGLPDWYADALLELYAAVRAGHVSATSPDCARLLEREPITFERFVTDYRGVFQPAKAGARA